MLRIRARARVGDRDRGREVGVGVGVGPRLGVGAYSKEMLSSEFEANCKGWGNRARVRVGSSKPGWWNRVTREAF